MKSMPLPLSPALEPVLPASARALAHAVRMGARSLLSSPFVLIGRGLSYVFFLVVLSSFWDVVARQPVAGALSHLPGAGLAIYIGVTEWVVMSTPALYLRLEDDIRSGAIEAQLLRPTPYLVMRIGEAAGAMVVRLAWLGAVALVLLTVSGRAAPPWPVLAGLLVLGPLGGLSALLCNALAGLTAFWARRTLAAYLVLQKLGFILGGLAAPVTLYPPWLARLAQASPFAAQMYWPAALTLEPSWRVFTVALISQAVWIGLLALALAAVWRAGLRKILRAGV